MKSIYDPRYQALISDLRKLRKSRHLTQTDMASFLCKPQSFIAKVERCERRLDVVELRDWLVALDTSLADFIQSAKL
jgi:transcriptional regulator with XRE-family HTH domain